MCPWERSWRPNAYLPECCQNTFVNLKCLSVFVSPGDLICRNKQLMVDGKWLATNIHACKDTQPHTYVLAHTHAHLRLNKTVFTLLWPLAWWKCADEQVDHALSPRLTSSAAGPAHHQTAAGAFTRSTAATSQETMRKCLTLRLCLPSKLAKWVWASGDALLFPLCCNVSYGSITGQDEGSLSSSIAWTRPGTAAGSSGSRSAL